MSVQRKQLQFACGPDGGAILDINEGLIFTLNPTAAYVWLRLQKGEPIEAIITSLAQETNESEAKIERDVADFVEELRQKRLLPT